MGSTGKRSDGWSVFEKVRVRRVATRLDGQQVHGSGGLSISLVWPRQPIRLKGQRRPSSAWSWTHELMERTTGSNDIWQDNSLFSPHCLMVVGCLWVGRVGVTKTRCTSLAKGGTSRTASSETEKTEFAADRSSLGRDQRSAPTENPSAYPSRIRTGTRPTDQATSTLRAICDGRRLRLAPPRSGTESRVLWPRLPAGSNKGSPSWPRWNPQHCRRTVLVAISQWSFQLNFQSYIPLEYRESPD